VAGIAIGFAAQDLLSNIIAGSVYFTVLEASKLALDAAGIQIPFPHLQLFWDEVEDRVIQKLATVPTRFVGDETAGPELSGS
jgi:small-conductance mechanosensitive channel